MYNKLIRLFSQMELVTVCWPAECPQWRMHQGRKAGDLTALHSQRDWNTGKCAGETFLSEMCYSTLRALHDYYFVHAYVTLISLRTSLLSLIWIWSPCAIFYRTQLFGDLFFVWIYLTTFNKLISCIMLNYKVITYQLVRVLEDTAVTMRKRGVMTPRISKFGIGVWCDWSD
jgi:hypothetical protein